MQITIGQGQGITQAIKTQIQSSGQTIKNNDLSVWTQVMQEVKTAQNNGQTSSTIDGEKKNYAYTGGDDTSKLGDKSSYKTDFQVVKDQVIEIAENVWNKIVSLLTGKASEEKTSQKTAENTVQAQTTPSAPKTGPSPEENPDYEKNMIYKGNDKQSQTSVPQAQTEPLSSAPKAGLSPEEDPQYDAIARGKAPVDAPKVDTTPSTAPKNNPQNSENLTQEDIQKAINNLKPGESFNYKETKSFNLPGLSSYQENPISWKRNEDSTLTKTTNELVHDSRGSRFVELSSHYSSDGKELLSAEVANGLPFAKLLVASENYKDGKPVTRETDLTNLNEKLGTTPMIGIDDPVTRVLKSVDNLSSAGKYESQEFKDKDGNTIISCKGGKFYNTKGKEIDMDKALKILNKSNTNGNLASLIQNYE